MIKIRIKKGEQIRKKGAGKEKRERKKKRRIQVLLREIKAKSRRKKALMNWTTRSVRKVRLNAHSRLAGKVRLSM